MQLATSKPVSRREDVVPMDREHANNAKTTLNPVSSAAPSPPSAPRTLSSAAAAGTADQVGVARTRNLLRLLSHVFRLRQSLVTAKRVD